MLNVGCGRRPADEGSIVAVSEFVVHKLLGPDTTILVARTRGSENGLGDLKVDQWRGIWCLARLERIIRDPEREYVPAQQDNEDIQMKETLEPAQSREHCGRRRL